MATASTTSMERNKGLYKTVPLATDREAHDTNKHESTEMSIRKCILKYSKEAEGGNFCRGNSNQESRQHVRDKTPVLGSDERVVHTNGNHGFFSTILEAYNNHWSLRTCVEDWWYTIIRKVAVAIDDNSKSKAVRDFFVSHEGKKTLTVVVGPSIYGVDYSWFLDQMTEKIAENVKVPNYVNLLKADFSTSTKTHIIVSEITVMASMQEYFEYEMMCGCGIPNLEMEGEEEDWKRLKVKFRQLKKMLKPIHKKIGLNSKWWKNVEQICDQLIDAFNGKPDIEWWSSIFSFEEGWPSFKCASYDGWFISELLGLGSITKLDDLQNGIITVPMTITDGLVKEESAFAAGIVGFEMWKEKDAKWPSVKAAHGWTLMLEPNSVFREELVTWESKYSKGG